MEIEWHTVEQKITTLSQKTLYKGKTKKIIINKYWDSHGDEIDWGTDTTKFDTEKDFEIISKTKEFQFCGGTPFTEDCWEIIVDGKRFDTEFELTGYKVQKTQLVLHGCVGAG